MILSVKQLRWPAQTTEMTCTNNWDDTHKQLRWPAQTTEMTRTNNRDDSKRALLGAKKLCFLQEGNKKIVRSTLDWELKRTSFCMNISGKGEMITHWSWAPVPFPHPQQPRTSPCDWNRTCRQRLRWGKCAHPDCSLAQPCCIFVEPRWCGSPYPPIVSAGYACIWHVGAHHQTNPQLRYPARWLRFLSSHEPTAPSVFPRSQGTHLAGGQPHLPGISAHGATEGWVINSYRIGRRKFNIEVQSIDRYNLNNLYLKTPRGQGASSSHKRSWTAEDISNAKKRRTLSP